MQVKHAIAEPWRGHLQEVQRAMRLDADQILILRGKITELETMQQSRRGHASTIVNLIRIEANLPETVNVLSDDGCFLIGEIEPVKEEPPA